jgi:DNA processing protein
VSPPEDASGRWIPDDSPEYPEQLRAVEHPSGLYVCGTLARDDALAIAIVGSRRASPYGLRVATTLARDLATRGFTIVSGLARGIDTAAHRGALEAGGRTLAVLGSGLDRVYPSENRNLARRIAEAGAVLSQFPPGTPPRPYHFPERNRVIAGLALGTVVVEAAEASGALITAGIAGDFGRLVFAVPGPITSLSSCGTNGLLRDGATLIRDWTDVVSELPTAWRDCVRADVPPPEPRETVTEGDEALVLASLGDEPLPIDRIIEHSGLGSGRAAAALIGLEVKGWARQMDGQRYVRVALT